MKTIALRFSNNFAPDIGTIAAHNAMIKENGFVWYGKLGSRISQKTVEVIMENENPKILLIHSGAPQRYWAFVDKVQNDIPEVTFIPSYYRDQAGIFKSWFRVIRFEEAPKNILSQCFVASSGAPLSNASRHSMSPYFIINYEESNNQ